MQDITDLKSLRYPIGKFDTATAFSDEYLEQSILAIDSLPAKLQSVVIKLSEKQLDTPYRPGSWTVRQLIHHIPDSHMHAYIRFKLALTEDKPIIKPYFEDRWAQLPDSKGPVDISLNLLQSLHQRWVLLLNSLQEKDWLKVYIHPEHQWEVPLKEVVGMYAWHSNHHLAHIENLVLRGEW